MLTKIVRQPIINTDGVVFAYELLYEDNTDYSSEETDAANIINDLLEQVDSEKFIGDKLLLLTFTPNLLLKNIPRLFEPSNLVIQIDDSAIVHPLAQRIIYRYKKQGYKIALNNFEFAPRFFQLMDIIDIIKLNFETEQSSFENIVTVAKSLNKKIIGYNINTVENYEYAKRIGKSLNKKIIGYNINTVENYEYAKRIGIGLMQGSVVAEHSVVEVRHLDYMKSNFFMLVISVNNDEPDIDEIAGIISRDVTLTYSLLRLVNSAYFALKNRATSVKVISVNNDEPDIDEIAGIISRDVTLTYSLLRLVNSAYFALKNRATSVKQALTILGIGQLKQWIYLLSFRNEKGEMPEELIRISFLRGTFCQELVPLIPDMPISRSEAYLLGMFSTLGRLMCTDLAEILENLPISTEIKMALISGEGMCGKLFTLILSYENANWREVDRISKEFDLDTRVITQKYLESVQTVNSTWDDLMSSQDKDDEE